jgi:hypothetical protein
MKQIQTYWDSSSKVAHNSVPMDDTNIPTGISSRSDCDQRLDGRAGTIYDVAHGIAIWVLASEIGLEVPYHIDYAKLLPYETGIIVPPIIAGTWHCTPNHNAGNTVSLLVRID